MRKNIFFLLPCFVVLVCGEAIAQNSTTSGFVLENLSKMPLEGVSVFYDGTSIGTITDENGYFEINVTKPITTTLVISYIGFESRMFAENERGFLGNILLLEKAFQLDEVVLKPDTWSREKKLNIFKREFLGTNQASLACRITNENEIRLYYNREKEILYAYAKVPIRITNAYLGYDISYNLRDFEVQFETDSSGFSFSKSTYTVGTQFFSERSKNKTKKRHLKNREKIYLGSVLHFMRALSQKKLPEENFKIFKDKFQVSPYSEFRISKKDGITKVTQLSEKLIILYDDVFQSSVEAAKATIFIDAYGNHSPPQNVYFGGVMGMQRVADMLPLDYTLPKKN